MLSTVFRRTALTAARMATAPGSLSQFLNDARKALQDKSRPVTVVTGNESADIDSLSSSILFAYLRGCQDEKRQYVPLTNLPRSDLKLRPEFDWLLQKAQLKPDELITLDEIQDLPEDAAFALVDHNELTGQLKQYQQRVNAVIDHHDDENAVSKEADPRIITKSGSCASLVLNHFQQTWKEEVQGEVSGQLATLTAGAMLIDTSNLTRKMTEHDTAAADFLKEVWPEVATQQKFFEDMTTAKADLSPLSLTEIFKKDYKSWETGSGKLGISSCVKKLAWLLHKARDESGASAKAGLLEAIEEFAEAEDLSVWALMTAFNDEGNTFHRELVIWTKNRAIVERLRGFGDSLELSNWKDGSLDQSSQPYVRAWQQGALEQSRKQVAPLLRDALGKPESSL